MVKQRWSMAMVAIGVSIFNSPAHADTFYGGMRVLEVAYPITSGGVQVKLDKKVFTSSGYGPNCRTSKEIAPGVLAMALMAKATGARVGVWSNDQSGDLSCTGLNIENG